MKFTTLVPTTYNDVTPEALKGVRRLGRKLGQRAMYFEVAGYDGVQFLRIE